MFVRNEVVHGQTSLLGANLPRLHIHHDYYKTHTPYGEHLIRIVADTISFQLDG